MQGSINFDGTLSGSIAGGGGGGSEVTITPVLTSGTKIADYSIDGQNDSLYAPDSGSEVTITPNYNSGFKVADYTIDGVAGVLYAPLTVNQGVSPLEVIGNKIRIDLSNYYDKTDCNNTFQKILTPGAGISINSLDVISVNMYNYYLNTEQNTGIKWIDNNYIYRKVVRLDNVSFTTAGGISGTYMYTYHFSNDVPSCEHIWVDLEKSYILEYVDNTWYQRSMIFYEVETDNSNNKEDIIKLYKKGTISNIYVYLALEYTKSA